MASQVAVTVLSSRAGTLVEEEKSTPFVSDDTALARAKGVGRKALASGMHFHRRLYPTTTTAQNMRATRFGHKLHHTLLFWLLKKSQLFFTMEEGGVVVPWKNCRKWSILSEGFFYVLPSRHVVHGK